MRTEECVECGQMCVLESGGFVSIEEFKEERADKKRLREELRIARADCARLHKQFMDAKYGPEQQPIDADGNAVADQKCGDTCAVDIDDDWGGEHQCDLLLGHDGEHQCRGCNYWWPVAAQPRGTKP